MEVTENPTGSIKLDFPFPTVVSSICVWTKSIKSAWTKSIRKNKCLIVSRQPETNFYFPDLLVSLHDDMP